MSTRVQTVAASATFHDTWAGEVAAVLLPSRRGETVYPCFGTAGRKRSGASPSAAGLHRS
jgi:hypothetical protein